MSQRLIRSTSAAALVATAVVSLALAASPVLAQIVVPGAQATAEGNTANAYPFGEYIRYQQVYGASAFGDATSPLLITQIAFRPDSIYGIAFAYTLSNVRIDMSTTSAAVDGLSTTFANNIGANNLTVLSGALSLSSSNTEAAGGARTFDIVMNLSSPFFYDPSAGNLLLDVYNLGNQGIAALDTQLTTGDAVSRVYNRDATSSTGTADTLGLITRFTVSPVTVPEANTFALALSALGMVGAVVLRRRKSTK